jgi:hypothetical protein
LLGSCLVCSFKKPHSFCYLRNDKRRQMDSISSNSQSATYLNRKEIIRPDLGHKNFLIYTNRSFLYSFCYGMRHHLYHLGRLPKGKRCPLRLVNLRQRTWTTNSKEVCHGP